MDYTEDEPRQGTSTEDQPRPGATKETDRRTLEDVLRSKQDWTGFVKGVDADPIRLWTSREVRKLTDSRAWYVAFLTRYLAAVEIHYRKSHRGPAFDPKALRDHKADITQRYFEAAEAFAERCDGTDEVLTSADLKDWLCLRLADRARFDARAPETAGIKVPRLKGKALARAIEEEGRRLGRPLTEQEKRTVSRWPAMTFIALDHQGQGDEGDQTTAHDWLDLAMDAEASWANGHVPVPDRIVREEDRGAFLALMIDLVRRHRERLMRSPRGPAIWEAVLRYVLLREKGENYGALGEICEALGVPRDEVEDELYNLSRNLVSAVVRKRPDLVHLLGEKSRLKARREIERRKQKEAEDKAPPSDGSPAS